MSEVHLDDFSSLFSLNGKVAVVTGGSRGLGLHAASGYVFADALCGTIETKLITK